MWLFPELDGKPQQVRAGGMAEVTLPNYYLPPAAEAEPAS
jgi:hypothetical protein